MKGRLSIDGQAMRTLRYLREHPGASCAVCGMWFSSAAIRGRHERTAHPEWTIPADLRIARAGESRRRWIERQGASAYWLRSSNASAARYGLAPLPLDSPLPVGPCSYCGGIATGWDHVVPMFKGGAHSVENLVPCCRLCNIRKHDTDADLARVPSWMDVLCGWCWTPIRRRRSQLEANAFASCSRAHTNLLRRWSGRAFGDPAFAGRRTRLEPVA